MRNAIRFVDLAAALFILAVGQGLYFCGDEELASYGWLYKLTDASLYSNDLFLNHFSYYIRQYYQYLHLLTKIVPLKLAALGNVLIFQVILLSSMRSLIEVITNKSVSAMLPALVLVIGGVDLIAGFGLTSPKADPHYFSIASSFAALALFIPRRYLISGCWMAVAVFFNYRIAMQMGMFMALICYYRAAPYSKKIFHYIAGFSLICLLAGGIYLYMTGNAFELIAQAGAISMYIRAPHHYLPALFSTADWLGLVMVTSTLVLLYWKKNTVSPLKELLLACLTIMLGMAVTVIINQFNLFPLFSLFNLFQAGPFILAIFYILVCVVFVEKLYQNHGFEAAVLLMAASRVMIGWAAFLWAISDSFIRQKPNIKAGMIAVALVIPTIAATNFGSKSIIGLPTDFTLPVWIAFFTSGLIIVAIAGYRQVGTMTTTALIGLAWVAAIELVGGGVSITIDQWRRDAAGYDMCRFVSQVTPIDSCFIIHPDMKYFQYISRRAAFATFKQIPQSLGAMPEWAARMKMLKVIPKELNPGLISGPVKPNFKAYHNLSVEDVRSIQKRYPFVSHWAVSSDRRIDLPLIFSNDKFRVYRLP